MRRFMLGCAGLICMGMVAFAQPLAPNSAAPPASGAVPSPLKPAVATDALAAERLNQLVAWMSGSFASTEQSKKDATYFDIRLHMTPIWTDRTDGRWLYVEQAMAGKLAQPYRQRVYRVTAVDAVTFRSEVFELPDGGAGFVGAWNDPSKFKNLTPEKLVAREGCALTLKFDEKAEGGPAFAGATKDRDCKSSLRGAAYATSEARITAKGMVSWDRGFDQAGKQVWGAESGGYQFVKIQDEPKPASQAPASTPSSAPPAPKAPASAPPADKTPSTKP